MGKIDFSNATIRCGTGLMTSYFNGTTTSSMLNGIGLVNQVYCRSSIDGQNGACNNVKSTMANITTNGFTTIKSGTVSISGNVLVISNASVIFWIIENIEFEAGDEFDFQVDVNITST